MSLVVNRSPQFDRDVIQQFLWYAERENEELAERFRKAVTTTLELLSTNPEIGPLCRIHDERFRDIHYFRVNPPFDRLLIFYRIERQTLFSYRLMHGMRDLAKRLAEGV